MPLFHILAAFLTLLALPHANAAAVKEETQVYMAGGRLNYIGPITAEANQKAVALYGAQADKPTVLSIRSGGGPVDQGMELGRWVRQRQLTVQVLELCFSSCANYVFTAAPHKIVSNFAVVGYHGGLSSADFALDTETEQMLAAMPEAARAAARAQILASVRATTASVAMAEQRYFKEIGVQQRITTLGQTDSKARLAQADDNMLGWTYGVDGFKKLGVDHITVVNPPWQPRAISGKFTVYHLAVD